LAAIAAYATISIAIACIVFITYCATPVAVGATAVLDVLIITPAHITAFQLPHFHMTTTPLPIDVLPTFWLKFLCCEYIKDSYDISYRHCI
jgi:hypothetical protein